jgi:hypothetical protein
MTVAGQVQRRGLPCCVSTMLRPAIVSVAERLHRLLFRKTDSVTVPAPFPDPPDEMTAHEAGLAAVHAQPAAADTVNETVVAGAGTVALPGDTAYVHEGAGAAACCTVKFHPAVSTVALRIVVSVFGATLYDTVAGPVLDAPAVTVTQDA